MADVISTQSSDVGPSFRTPPAHRRGHRETQREEAAARLLAAQAPHRLRRIELGLGRSSGSSGSSGYTGSTGSSGSSGLGLRLGLVREAAARLLAAQAPHRLRRIVLGLGRSSGSSGLGLRLGLVRPLQRLSHIVIVGLAQSHFPLELARPLQRLRRMVGQLALLAQPRAAFLRPGSRGTATSQLLPAASQLLTYQPATAATTSLLGGRTVSREEESRRAAGGPSGTIVWCPGGGEVPCLGRPLSGPPRPGKPGGPAAPRVFGALAVWSQCRPVRAVRPQGPQQFVRWQT